MISSSGYASSVFSIGETKSVPFIDNENILVEIVGFNHDTISTGGTAGITFGTKNAIENGRKKMRDTRSNYGGFKITNIYSKLNTDSDSYYSYLPQELQQKIKAVDKITAQGGISGGTVTESVKLFLFSDDEVFNQSLRPNTPEGSQYSRFSNSSSRLKNDGDSGSAVAWWLRSPYSDGGQYGVVELDGTLSHRNSDVNTPSICFGFCV